MLPRIKSQRFCCLSLPTAYETRTFSACDNPRGSAVRLRFRSNLD